MTHKDEIIKNMVNDANTLRNIASFFDILSNDPFKEDFKDQKKYYVKKLLEIAINNLE